ncbi:MAG: A/G-specific adenine glycosylase [Gemmatimonadetes bacterium]|nr:A/G-specific adenine glycosylase [Gemmatimonadota bacterium]
MTTPKPPCHALAFKRRLLAWFRREGRDLPWRRTRDPYHVLVSEFMLQQTQVARVTQYYGRFLNRYPTIKALAKARSKAVREAWDGLGYYRRAANLHSLAKTVERDYGGKIPTRPEELRRLPGVGAYTAGAVLAFAYEQPAAVVDTNVERVIRRAFHTRCATDAAASRKITETASALQPKRGRTAWEFNQALMDLGAMICLARSPRCPQCPVRPVCKTGRRTK